MSIPRELKALERRAYRPGRWLLFLTALLLIASYYPLTSVLVILGLPDLLYRLLVPLLLIALFVLVQWPLDLWSHRRFDRLITKREAARNVA